MADSRIAAPWLSQRRMRSRFAMGLVFPCSLPDAVTLRSPGVTAADLLRRRYRMLMIIPQKELLPLNPRFSHATFALWRGIMCN